MRRIDFTEALAILHGLIDREIHVVVNLPGFFFDCGFGARLERVQTLDEPGGPVLMVFGDDEGIAVDPAELRAYRAGAADRGGEWLELHFADRARVVIEPQDPSRRPGRL